MFYKDTNLLPRHSGVFFAIVILLVLLVLNFDKCYMSLVDVITNWFMPKALPNPTTIENFEVGAESSIPTVKKISMQIFPEKREITAKFEKVVSNIPTGHTLKNYLLVLAKYNKDLVQVDSLNVKLSNELGISTTSTGATTTTSTGATTTTSMASTPNSLGDSICNKEGICSYTFTDLDTKDEEGNIYYYKLGAGVVYNNNGNDVYSNITTYNFGTGNSQQYFRIDIDMPEQEKLLRRLAEIESASLYTAKEQKAVETDTEETKGKGTDIDAYMKMLRPYIGNYPDEFTLNNQKIKDLTLDSYLDESYAVGEFNLNVNLGNIMPAPTTSTDTTV